MTQNIAGIVEALSAALGQVHPAHRAELCRLLGGERSLMTEVVISRRRAEEILVHDWVFWQIKDRLRAILAASSAQLLVVDVVALVDGMDVGRWLTLCGALQGRAVAFVGVRAATAMAVTDGIVVGDGSAARFDVEVVAKAAAAMIDPREILATSAANIASGRARLYAAGYTLA